MDDKLTEMKKEDEVNLWFNYNQAKYIIKILLDYNGNFYDITGHKTQIFKDIEELLYFNKTMIIDKSKREKIKAHSMNTGIPIH